MDKIRSLQNFDVLLLSAGIGSRLKKFRIPKSLIKIENITILDLIINKLLKYNIKNIFVVVGYKNHLIKKELKKFKNLKIHFLYNKNYKNYGSGYSWYLYLKKFLKRKKPILMLHTDILFHDQYLKSITNSPKKNIISTTVFNKKNTNPLSLIAKFNSKKKISAINYQKKLPRIPNEIACINKFSHKMLRNFFFYMRAYFQKSTINKKKTWELIINDFIIDDTQEVYSVCSKKKWVNVNTNKDYNKARKLFC